jgi:hypothetical protein
MDLGEVSIPSSFMVAPEGTTICRLDLTGMMCFLGTDFVERKRRNSSTMKWFGDMNLLWFSCISDYIGKRFSSSSFTLVCASILAAPALGDCLGRSGS